MIQTRLRDFVQRLTPPTRSNLLDELERLELCGDEIPGLGEVMDTLRAEFRGTFPYFEKPPSAANQDLWTLRGALVRAGLNWRFGS